MQQTIGDFGEIVGKALLRAAGEEGERLKEAFDVRIGAAIGLEHEPRGHTRIGSAKLLRHLTNEEQLAFVIGEKGFIHAGIIPPLPP